MLLRLFPPLLFLALVTVVVARLCVDDVKGYCEAHDIWGYCFHNKTSGRFNCDDDGSCSKNDAVKTRRTAGCANGESCCCKDGDGCSLRFINMNQTYKHGQQCAHKIERPNADPEHYKPCDDPYCYSLLTAEEEGGLTTAHRGCYHRALLKHRIFMAEDEKFHNNSRWKESERLFSVPSCREVMLGFERNDTQPVSHCVDFTYEEGADGEEEEEKIPMKGRLCCCIGGAQCNVDHSWASRGVSLPELQQKIEAAKAPKSTSSALFSFFNFVIFLFSRL